MDAAQFFVKQQADKFERDCLSAIQQVKRAKTMWDVKRAAHVVAHPVLRGIRLNRAGAGRLLERGAEERMDALLTEQLKEAAGLTDMEARKAFLGGLRHREWDALRGDFASLYRKADMEGQRLLAKP
ncbi:hypothetical protein WJ97_11080 [Burkholderia ubonensis]|uniref:hypothetical protein n=1 Tax=Burkholderia ubonensis TaxID=101571 RepID=UPI00075B8945|nr:hypothetical protein [Burkholderia ubonensis]KVP96425.1 hypothetical protein WJ97_11080 [Burkholderia ubonensis]